MPDFTLHGVDHSDNIVFLLVQLLDLVRGKLSEYEARILGTAAYLHDLGMFFSGRRWEQRVRPALPSSLSFCAQGACDNPAHYGPRGSSTPDEVRIFHHLLSALLILEAPEGLGIDKDDAAYVAVVCRGHRRADLRSGTCSCFQTRPLRGQPVRLGVLASLLRLADAIDYYPNRAPRRVFESNTLDLLWNPKALEHWVAHYFVADPQVLAVTGSGSGELTFRLNCCVPDKRVGGVSYRDFLSPLLEYRLRQMLDGDLDRAQYPAEFLTLLGMYSFTARLSIDVLAGAREFPPEVLASIEQRGSTDALDWIRRLESEPARMLQRDAILSWGLHEIIDDLSGVVGIGERLRALPAKRATPTGIADVGSLLVSIGVETARLARGLQEAVSTGVAPLSSQRQFLLADMLRSAVGAGKPAAKSARLRLSLAIPDWAETRMLTLNEDFLRRSVWSLLNFAISQADPNTEIRVRAETREREILLLVVFQGTSFHGYQAEIEPSASLGLHVAAKCARLAGAELLWLGTEEMRSPSKRMRTAFAIVLGG